MPEPVAIMRIEAVDADADRADDIFVSTSWAMKQTAKNQNVMLRQVNNDADIAYLGVEQASCYFHFKQAGRHTIRRRSTTYRKVNMKQRCALETRRGVSSAEVAFVQRAC